MLDALEAVVLAVMLSEQYSKETGILAGVLPLSIDIAMWHNWKMHVTAVATPAPCK